MPGYSRPLPQRLRHKAIRTMTPDQPRATELRDHESLPLFPLTTVLFPQGSLSLQIFEVRYLDMVSKCHKSGTPFGVVSLLRGSEVRRMDRGADGAAGFAQEQFVDVGTLATIVEFSAPQAGLMVVRCSGQARFRINARSQLKHGLWVADVTELAHDPSTPIPQDLQPISVALERLIESQRNGDAMVEPLPINLPYRFDDCGWVANRWCDLLSMPASMKQSLMQLDNPLLRLELVGDLLGKNLDALTG
jgi:Lon protease-like protein